MPASMRAVCRSAISATSSTTACDLGISYIAHPSLTVGLVAANVGQPVVRGLKQQLTYTPAFTWHPSRIPALGFSADARLTTDSVAAYAFGLSWRGRSRWPVEIIARLDTDRGLRRGAFVLGLTVGAQDRIGTVASTPGDVSGGDGVSLYGLSTREPVRRR